MKYYYSILAVVACMFAACGTNDLPVYSEPEPEGPTQKEKNMVMDEMTWRLDSVLVIKNYQQPDETSYMVYAGEDFNAPPISYTFYPCDYQFPNDLLFYSDMDPDMTHNISELFNEGYCKYLCTYYGEPVAAGYLTYYKDKFTFYGLQQGGWIEFMMREADTDWDKEVWTVAYNTNVDFDGTVLERCIEYYSRLEIDAIAEGEDYDLPGGMYVTDLGKTSALVICSLPEGATGWNLHYREVPDDSEQEMRWVTISNLTTRSYTIEDLKPGTNYVVRLQAVYGDDVSGWTRALPFTTLGNDAQERANKQETAFIEYKEVKKAECDAMAMPEIDDKHYALLIEQAKQAIDDLGFNENLSFDENLGNLDEITRLLAIDLSVHRGTINQ